MRHGKDGWDLIEYAWAPECIQRVYELGTGAHRRIVKVTIDDPAAAGEGGIPVVRVCDLEPNERDVYL